MKILTHRTTQMVALTLLGFLGQARAADKVDDAAFRKALTDELARSMKDLRLGSEPQAYQLGYEVTDVDQVNTVGSLGALISSTRNRRRTLTTQMRVGDAKFDQTGFSDGGYAMFASAYPSALPVEDDYLALRRELWLRTDEAYKHNVETLAKKKAAEQSEAKSDNDAVVDFSSVPPLSHVSASEGSQQALDTAQLENLVRKLSLIFKKYPEIQDSSVSAIAKIERRRLLTSEGTWVDEKTAFARLSANAETQASDGMRLRSYLPVVVLDMKAMPPIEVLEKQAREMADDLVARRQAPVPENGNAVVIFAGRAAPQLLRRLVGTAASGTPNPKVSGEAERRSSGAVPRGEFASQLNQRVAPAFFNAYDDPRVAKTPDGSPLAGSYQVDDEGVAAQRVSLVEKGIVKGLLMSRTPRKEFATANGHGRGTPNLGVYRATVGNLFISAGSDGLNDKALRLKATRAAKEMGAGTAIYVVRLIDSQLEGEPSFGGEGAHAPPVQPLVVTRLKEGKPDEKEELVRGVTFEGLSPKSLKDLVAMGKTATVYNTRDGSLMGSSGGPGVSVIAPALVFKDVEVRKRAQKNPKLPAYPRPEIAVK